MSGARRRPAAGSGQKRQRRSSILSLHAARKMFPLVRHILAEIQQRWQRIALLELEQADLEHRRLNLAWPERSRRYSIGEEIAAEQAALQETVAELEHLEVVLVDPARAEVAFPTSVNGRRAYFLWDLDSPDLTAWCYASDRSRHAIPAAWFAAE